MNDAAQVPAWDADHLVDPHGTPDKARRVRRMFAAIAGSYDLNNRVHSFGRDQAWRRAAVKAAAVQPGERVVDIACGTGDLALLFSDTAPPPATVIGIDFTYEMLPLAAEKARRSRSAGSLQWLQGDALRLPLPDACCDVVSIAFGLRNVADPSAVLAEFRRVLRPGGRLVILEFSQPRNPLIRLCNRIYCGWIMPRTATLLSGDRSGAYHYLPRSVSTFATPAELADMLRTAGFDALRQTPLTFGTATLHLAQ